VIPERDDYQVAPTVADPPQAVSVTVEMAIADTARKIRPRADRVSFFMSAVPFYASEFAPLDAMCIICRSENSNGLK
jgi:hypothetical protein